MRVKRRALGKESKCALGITVFDLAMRNRTGTFVVQQKSSPENTRGKTLQRKLPEKLKDLAIQSARCQVTYSSTPGWSRPDWLIRLLSLLLRESWQLDLPPAP